MRILVSVKTADVKYYDNGKTMIKTYEWQGWTEALKDYNGEGVGVKDYEKYINQMVDESVEPQPSNYNQ